MRRVSRGKKENILQPYDFNHKREYLIYLNACGKKLNKKESVLIGKDRFSTYEQWSEYVRGKYSCISTGSLESFLRYLRYLLRSAMKVEGSLLLYEDYIEIIEGILESRKKSESNQI